MSIDLERQLRKIRKNDLKHLKMSKDMGYVDSITFVGWGSFLGRTGDKYQEILSHNGAPDIIDHVKGLQPDSVIVDAGCGAGLALAELRAFAPNARLVGIDIRNTPQNFLTDVNHKPICRAEVIHQRAGVEFHQDIYLNLHTIAPDGYDLFMSVGAFYEVNNPEVPHAPVLKYIYDGLRQNGIALIQYNPLQQTWDKAKEGLEAGGIPYQFVPANPEVLRNHALNSPKGLLATLVVGPKP